MYDFIISFRKVFQNGTLHIKTLLPKHNAGIVVRQYLTALKLIEFGI